MKNLFAILIIIASIGIYFGFIQPTWGEIDTLKKEEAVYQEALEKVNLLSTTLEQQRSLIASIPAEDLERLEKLLPDNVDNVKLIIDINNIASVENLSIRQIGIADPKEEAPNRQTSVSSRVGYDFIDLSFNITAPYDKFITFLTNLEKSLRLVDVISISFQPTEITNTYDFSVTLRTYWLK